MPADHRPAAKYVTPEDRPLDLIRFRYKDFPGTVEVADDRRIVTQPSPRSKTEANQDKQEFLRIIIDVESLGVTNACTIEQ